MRVGSVLVTETWYMHALRVPESQALDSAFDTTFTKSRVGMNQNLYDYNDYGKSVQ